MRVWVYPDKEWQELGARRFEVEWQTVKPKAKARIDAAEAKGELDEVDPDTDLDYHYRAYTDKQKALRAARGVVNLRRTAYGCATVTEQVVDWYVEEDRIAEWANVGEPEYVD